MKRQYFEQKIQHCFNVNPVVGLLGPRQCGKTTLAKLFAHKKKIPKENYFDLENNLDLARLKEPALTLKQLEGTIVIDEVQLFPNLFRDLRVLVDDENFTGQLLILGSASQELIRQSAETLAGRISYIELTPFSSSETGEQSLLWLRGGYPRSYLAINNEISTDWRKDYIRTFLEKDIPNLGINIPAKRMRRFWMMLAHYHGNIFNASELGRAMQTSYKTIQEYTDILSGTFMIRQLQPWFENISKRQVKSPKIYFRDTGIYHSLLGIENLSELRTHPKLGASWEGFAMEEVIRTLKVDEQDCYFWATHQQAELDLLIFDHSKKRGFEFKYSDAPKLTKSMRIALEDLKLDTLTVIYPGTTCYPLAENVKVVGLQSLLCDPLILTQYN